MLTEAVILYNIFLCLNGFEITWNDDLHFWVKYRLYIGWNIRNRVQYSA